MRLLLREANEDLLLNTTLKFCMHLIVLSILFKISPSVSFNRRSPLCLFTCFFSCLTPKRTVRATNVSASERGKAEITETRKKQLPPLLLLLLLVLVLLVLLLVLLLLRVLVCGLLLLLQLQQ